jgi:UDP-N-acetylglucosamine:LPS N-acetylglucosamine transferase
MLLQRDLTPAAFAGLVDPLLRDPARLVPMAAAALGRGKPHAADEIVSHLLTLF